MPIARMRNDLPWARVRTTDLPSAYARFGAILTAGTDTLISAGTPIGLLLTLTYANAFTLSTAATFIGEQPTARIRNVD